MARQRGSAANGRGRTTAYAAGGAALLAALAFAAPAAAQGTGGSLQTTGGAAEGREAPPLSDPPPGVVVRRPSEVGSWRCLADCAEAGAVHSGSRLRLRGRRLGRTYEVVFLGAEGDADDVATAPQRPKRGSRIDVEVPLGAATGPILVSDRDGQRSAPAAAPLPVPPPTVPALAGGPPSVEVQTQARRAFFDAERPAEVTYVVHGSQPARVLVELLRERDGAVVESWEVAEAPPEVPQTLTWDGTVDGRVERQGRYSFRVSAVGPGGVRAVSAQAPAGGPDPASFVFLKHAFPILGPHGYGEHAASFGGGRGHQGQDVFAACGTPLVAARGGVVEFKQYHGRAGHYIVVDGERTGTDYAYMHMREEALVDEGDRVRTGEPIGYVGDSGSASGCHLHLETWSAPGWYGGGRPFDPLPSLLAWDRRS